MARRKNTEPDNEFEGGSFFVDGILRFSYSNSKVVGSVAEVTISLSLAQSKLLDKLASQKNRAPLGFLQERIEKDILKFLPIKK